MKARLHRHRHTKKPTAVENQVFSENRSPNAFVPPQVRAAEHKPEHIHDAPENEIENLLTHASRQPLPFRTELGTLLGQPVPPDVQVINDPNTQALLDNLDAQALVRDQVILLDEASPDFDTVAHEVIHLLQVNGQLPPTTDVVAWHDPAEQEARLLTEHLKHRQGQTDWNDFLPLSIDTDISPLTLAALRGDAPPAPVSETDVADRNLEQSLAGPDQQPESGSAAPEPETPEPDTTIDDIGPVEELEDETLEPPELPAAPEPGVTEADLEARRQALAEAEAALEGAEDPKAVVDGYALAPPTLKAREAGSVDQSVNAKTASKEQTYQENLPDFHAEMQLQSEEVEADAVNVPEQEAVNLEADTPGPTPDVDLPPTPDHGEYSANDDVVSAVRSWLNSWFGDDRSTRIGNNLRNVNTTDANISADPGAAPRVPLEGETDPERITNQRDETAEQSRQKRDEAQQAVLDGPGPEQVQPRNVNETVEIGELEQPDVQASIETDGPDTYLQYELPEEVDTAFDQENQQAMEESFIDAKTQVQEATDSRDRDRQAAVDEAETESQRLSNEADTDQREQVIETRTTIQNERQSTLDAQREAVSDLETNVEDRRAQDQQDIDNRIEEDEQQVRTDYDQAERDSQAEIDTGERDAETEKRESEREAEDQSWWDRAVNFVKAAFEALTAAINAIFDAVRAAVNAILDAVKAVATALIRAAADFVKGAITAFGEFAKGAVNFLLADTFPGLARALNEGIDGAVATANRAVDAVADTLIAGVNALVEGLRGALNALLDAFQAALNTVLQIMQAALTGDWAAVIRLAFEAVLKVAGINPEDVYAFIGRAMETLNIILNDPLGFVGNLFDAFIGGVRQFADRMLTHLQAGIIGWLTGTLGPAGINLPQQFNLMGVLDIVRQVLGFTWDNIRSRVVRIIGERAIQVLEFLYGYIETLITGGWGALWEQITSDLEGLRDMVFDQIKEFVLTRLVIAAVTRLATMFNPVGAIVNLLIMAYQFYTFLRDNIQRLVQLIQSFFEAIGNIARGVLGPAMDRVEGTLAQFLPLAIDLVARLIGLGNVGGRVRRIMTRVQDRIWGAIDRMIERVMGRFRGGDTVTDAVAEAGDGAGQLGERLPIPAPDGTHHLSIEVAGNDITFVVSSDPKTVEELVTIWRGRIGSVPEDQRREVTGRIDALANTENASERTIEELLRDADVSEGDRSTAVGEQRKLQSNLRYLFGIFGLEGAGLEGARQVQVLFEDTLRAADQDARPDVEEVLVEKHDEMIENSAKHPQWEQRFQNSNFYRSPLFVTTNFGSRTRDEAEPWVNRAFNQIEQTEQAKPADERRQVFRFDSWPDYHRARVVKIHGGDSPFIQSRDLVRTQILNPNPPYTRTRTSQFYREYQQSIIDTAFQESIPDHHLYRPIDLRSADAGNRAFVTYNYNPIDIIDRTGATVARAAVPQFQVTLHDGRTARANGTGLQLKAALDSVRSGQRGTTHPVPNQYAGAGLNSSHLIPDAMMGSGFRDSNNLVLASAYYNQSVMLRAETDIVNSIVRRANREAASMDQLPQADPEDVVFNLSVTVGYAQSVFDPAMLQMMRDTIVNLLHQNEVPREERQAFYENWSSILGDLNNQGFTPVRNVRYRVTSFYRPKQGGGPEPLGTFTRNIGADIYIGFNLRALRDRFRRASPS